MTRLQDALEDLTTDVPSYVEVDASAAWRAGRRRRMQRYAASSAVVAVIAVLVASAFALPSVDRPEPADTGGRVGVTGYPTRIGHQWFERDLPRKPGPLAGLVQRYEVRSDGSRTLDGWYALSPTGRQWRLVEDHMDIQPALSPDGTVVVFFDPDAGELVIHDVVSGDVRRLPRWSDPILPIKGDWYFDSQMPHFWSPDGRRVLLAAYPNRLDHDMSRRVLLDVRTGAVSLVPIDNGLAGWYDNESLLRVGTPNRNTVRVEVVRLDGESTRTMDLSPAEPLADKDLNQFDKVYSAGTGQLLVVSGDSLAQAHRLRVTSPGPSTVTPVSNTSGPCSHGWAATSPYVSTRGDEPRTALVTSNGLRPMVTVESEDVDCIVWARDAIGGTPHGSIFGSSTAWWTWWWRELSLGAALLVGVVGLGLWLRRRRHP